MLFRASTLVVVACLGACNPRAPEPFVVVIGLDVASLDIVDELRALGELPTFDRLIRTGAEVIDSEPAWIPTREKVRARLQRRQFETKILLGQDFRKIASRSFTFASAYTKGVWWRLCQFGLK